MANPIPVGDWAYISSEHLKVTITGSFAKIEGRFTFRSTGSTGRLAPDDTGYIQIPVWLPDTKSADEKTARLLAFCTSAKRKIDGPLKESLAGTLSPKIIAGAKEIQIESVSLIEPTGWRGRGADPSFERKGYRCLMLHVSVPASLISRGQTVSISYRQPMHTTRKVSEFHYVPLFRGLPSDATTTDLTRYSLSLRNDSQRTLTLGGATIQPAASAVLPLSHACAITVQTPAGK